jgi:hypothetical protein
MGTFHGDQYPILDHASLTSSWNEICFKRKLYKNTSYVPQLLFSKAAVYETMWEKYGRARQATDDNIIRRMCMAFWIHKVTNTHSEYVIFISTK